jgi:D-alanyl-D-alanine carboxypeptidase (penicillin-binding protein 5/6)
MRLISVIMGAPNDQVRTEDSIRLLTYGFRFYETHKVYGAATPVTKVRVWKGSNKEIALGVKQDLFVTAPTGQYKNVQTKIELNEPIKAPIEKGQALGTVNIVFNNQVLTSAPLVALEADAKGGLWRRISDAFHFSYYKIFSRTNEKANNG